MTTTMTFTFDVTRDESGHWIGRGPNGIHSFARRIDLLPARLSEAIAVAMDIEPPDPKTLNLTIDYDALGLPADAIDCVKVAAHLRNEITQKEKALSESTRCSVDALTHAGFTTRDIGSLLGITFQRVQQLNQK